MNLRRSIRLAVVTAMALSALSALGASGALAGPAPQWWVNGALLGAKASKNFKGTSTEPTRISVPGAPVVLESATGECATTGTIEGAPAKEQPGTENSVTLSCTNTKVKEAAACTVKSVGQGKGELVFALMKSTLVWMALTGEAAGNLLAVEKAGLPLTEIEFAGTCPIKAGTYPLAGSVVSPFKPIGAEQTPVTMEFREPAPTKWWNNNAPRQEQAIGSVTFNTTLNATIQGSFSVQLVGGEKFGVFPG